VYSYKKQGRRLLSQEMQNSNDKNGNGFSREGYKIATTKTATASRKWRKV
jgi:hypothetical protein